jgi:hypothetical protein
LAFDAPEGAGGQAMKNKKQVAERDRGVVRMLGSRQLATVMGGEGTPMPAATGDPGTANSWLGTPYPI